jgi:hypothetical protein
MFGMVLLPCDGTLLAKADRQKVRRRIGENGGEWGEVPGKLAEFWGGVNFKGHVFWW